VRIRQGHKEHCSAYISVTNSASKGSEHRPF